MKVKIYTKTGDQGFTSTYKGIRILKSDPQVAAYGSIDELNSILGVLINYLNNEKKIKNFIVQVQSDLFAIGAFLAGNKISLKYLKTRVTLMEKLIDELESRLPLLKNFILPGGKLSSAWANFSRAVCRRAERKVVRLKTAGFDMDGRILIYLNRLSDLLFIIGRYSNFRLRIPEIIWKKKDL
ncbi:ATP:cob(I)alamin adenosyltransferase [Candidatus Gottesmanbacteria bacterium RIFCSPHIGHO2_02_FULL_40_24]|uniref:Corrinoid adenosyltransferase n=1 Tax=Candidatus Gottesmanbacteria bacterium RIFCSPHIGHO2_01_FULL_40_15 TaxID=1798376 RepID=A0A1F5Z616_9BACT|nr:MAG: ATP:cob(I)alamin adenosyltransferase [Candidatus Gottesmanbacteria bacterium RIFCSPHIGHO2_01_FULL_40_15]OGG18732.1 MAG: ATP:cob(I)alamin adenosyltransferase [Candidatus Gottesmanbacteria bacterium RIFCSPHIGHO2_02_FULL_40_24]OGG20915.1 MAG: ATP:cob(I)alamin adenosyltransferase [Candidatus Gottesmanbacteria bacterium RIFCSPLOWO2_01_FULL_40_10]OGG23023.1 MAG: ATP:cob(I)alamin adenosyltransferase [Candidatus Gottesmanbacteria bacterium RIFCSPHIGHO2_12_FULL_40_13]OGG32111.1 MAG: ATP:cob(I)al